jgi:pseudouridine synthase
VGQSRSKSEVQVQGTRLNKCLTGLSRRAADEAIEGGRVTVNGAPARCGTKVLFGDKVRLDGQLQRWEQLQRAKTSEAALLLEDRKFAYLKYWKPAGVTSTSDPTDSSNIIAAGKFHLFPQRLFSVGRLDKDSTGLILMTSDGRVNNALLSSALKKEKVYEVTLNRVPSDAHVQQLAEGVAITTTAQRDGRARDLTRATLPCKVTRMGGPESRRLQFVLVEGRNRQIRKMVESIGYEVVALHRTAFAGITLKGLSCGNWAELNEKEMLVVQRAVETAAARTSEQSAADGDDEDFD